MFRLLFLLSCVALSLGDTVVLNDAVDQLLQGLRTELVNEGKDQIAIPEMKHDWKYRWHFIKISGHINCRDGWAKSLASIQRTGDVSMSTEGNRVTLQLALGLGTLEAGFHHCQVKAKRLLSVTQKVTASVSSNSIEAQISITRDGDQCTVNLDKIALANLGSIKLHTGGGVIHKVEDKILNRFTGHFHDKIKDKINQILLETATKNLPKADLCNRLPH